MTAIAKYYAPLSDVVTFDQLPDGLGFIRDGVGDFFDNIFYDNLIESTSNKGNAAFYSLDIISPKKLAIEIPGTGISLVLNPAHDDSAVSSFPVTVFWQWEILAYLDDFDFNTFSFSPEDFFKLGTKILGVSEETALELALRAFVEPQGTAVTRIEQFVSDVNALYGTSVPVPPESENEFSELLESLAQAGIESSYAAIFALYITDSDVDTAKEKLQYFFSSFLPEDFESYISNLLIPKARATVLLSLGIEFPRNILLPVTEQGQVILDVNTTFVFPRADFLIDTESGIGYELEFAGSLEPPFASIANTGLIVQIDSLKIDLSKKTNIKEADLDGRPIDFTGIYARAISITLPSKWFHEVQGQTSNTLRIGAYNVLIGTGGISGTILLETVPALNGGQITDYYFNHFALNYPVNIFKKNETTDVIEEVILQDNNALLSTLNANLAAGYTSVFEFPISVTTTSNETKTFDNVGDYQRYLSTLSNDNILWKSLGENGFKVGFSKFDVAFQYGKIISSDIQGGLIIPNFKDALGNDAQIDVTGHLYEDGDFSLTAAVEAGVVINLGDDGSVFKVIIKSLSIGRDDEKIYLEVTGDLDFSNNSLLKTILTKPLEIKKLRIYSDGSFEIEGGSIPIPASVHLNLGPVEVDITNITLGAEKLNNGDYKFIGFDCGVSTGAGGLDLRGDGIKIYFNHDGSDMFLRIAGIGIDLMIPGTASEESAALILKGYLSIKEDEYIGAVSFRLPKAKIAGGAAMKMKPKIPAFAVDAFVELAAPIPLGSTGLGIFGFRGLFGLRYIADLPAGATSNPDKMFDFYVEKKLNPLSGNLEKGLHLGKIVTPEQRADGFKNSGTPISIGAGVSLGTAADAGRAFSMQAFLFLSLPEFFMISGKGSVLSERVSIISEKEPPFFAYLAITSQYISVGMGAEYKIRENTGEFIELNVEAQMAFFFNDASAWYVHFGTKEEPNQAKVLKKIFNLNAYAYFMLSVAGIETGAGIKFSMSKRYGPVSVNVSAYCDIYAMISFRKPQVGGGIACGGNISARVFGIGFDITLDAYLMLTVPKPFLVKGGVRVCLEVDFWIKTWRKCFNVDFKWEFEQQNDLSQIKIIDEIPFPVAAYHIGSKNMYGLTYFETALPNPSDTSIETIPLDTYIDIQLKKPVNPNNVIAKIGGITNAPTNNIEKIPPKEVEKQVTHRFDIADINIKVWNRHNNSWQNYHPYEALDPGSFLQNVDPATLRIGSWQKKGKEYNNLRILADSPFSFADNMSGGFIPEQMGVTAATLFCRGKEIANHCVRWNESRIYPTGKWHSHRNISFEITKFDAAVVPFSNVFNIPYSLKFKNKSKLEIILPEKCLRVSLKLSSFARSVKISFFDLQDKPIRQNGLERNLPVYVLVRELILSSADFLVPVIYEDDTQPIKKIIIEAIKPDDKTVQQLQNVLEDLTRQKLEGNAEVEEKIKSVKAELNSLQALICDVRSKETKSWEIRELTARLEAEKMRLAKEAARLKNEINKKCKVSADLRNILDRVLKEKQRNSAEADSFFDDLKEIQLFSRQINSLKNLRDKNRSNFKKTLNELATRIERDFNAADKICRKLRAQYKDLSHQIRLIEEKLKGLKEPAEPFRDETEDRCATYLHEVCYLTQTDWWYNQSIPSQAAVESDYNLLNDAVSKVIQPIWRPNELYAIEIKTLETVDSQQFPHNYYFAFKTAGPIGHFPLSSLPEELKKQYGLNPDGTPENTNTKFDKKIEIPENSLKFYIDYNKSYPNPIGNIINQKPLFYNNPNLLIFYSEPFVYHFFNNWANYNSLGQRFASMKIEVKDPAENLQQNTSLPPVLTVFPNAILNWKTDPSPPVKQSIEVINNLRNPKIKNVDFNGQTCWQIGGDPIIPASKSSEIKVENLKPSKLYNAVIFSRYSGNADTFQETQIHSYPFQTSRYADLNEQVKSYHLKEFDQNTGQLLNEKDAVYKVSLDLNSLGVTLSQLNDVISHADEANNFRPALIQNYPNAFQRLLFGYLKQEPLLPATNTEINLLENENNELLGIWVRNPEPFNDPRIPFEHLQNTIQLIVNNQLVNLTIPLFSKDNSEFIIFHNSLTQDIDSLNLTFVYLLWNGSHYIQAQTVTTENLITP